MTTALGHSYPRRSFPAIMSHGTDHCCLQGSQPGHLLRRLLELNGGIYSNLAVQVFMCPYHAHWVSEEINTLVRGAAELASMNESMSTELERLRWSQGTEAGRRMVFEQPHNSRNDSPADLVAQRNEHNRLYHNATDAGAARRELEQVLRRHEDAGRLSQRECQRIRGLAYQIQTG